MMTDSDTLQLPQFPKYLVSGECSDFFIAARKFQEKLSKVSSDANWVMTTAARLFDAAEKLGIPSIVLARSMVSQFENGLNLCVSYFEEAVQLDIFFKIANPREMLVAWHSDKESNKVRLNVEPSKMEAMGVHSRRLVSIPLVAKAGATGQLIPTFSTSEH